MIGLLLCALLVATGSSVASVSSVVKTEGLQLRDDQQAEMVRRINAIAAEIRGEDEAIRRIETGPCLCGAVSHTACQTPNVCEPKEEADKEQHRARIRDLRGMLPKVRALVTGIQKPEVLLQTAKSLADAGTFAPTGKQTYCDRFLDAFARGAYAYTEFQDRPYANGILDLLRQTPGEWKALYDVTAEQGKSGRAEERRPIDKATLQTRLDDARKAADEGYLVVIGLVTGPKDRAGGHVCVVLPGEASTEAGSWARAGLPDRLPLIAQAGRDVFAGKHLNYGFTPADLLSGELVIYVRRP